MKSGRCLAVFDWHNYVLFFANRNSDRLAGLALVTVLLLALGLAFAGNLLPKKLKQRVFLGFYIVSAVTILWALIGWMAESPKNFYETYSTSAQAVSIDTKHNSNYGRWVKYRENGRKHTVFVNDVNIEVEQRVGKAKKRAVLKQYRLKPEWKKYQQRVSKEGTEAHLKITEYHPNKWIETK